MHKKHVHNKSLIPQNENNKVEYKRLKRETKEIIRRNKKKNLKYILQIKLNPTPKNFTPMYVIKKLSQQIVAHSFWKW